jgi:hypothetical protein
MLRESRGRTLIRQGAMPMTSVTIEEAQARLPELISEMVEREELEITKGNEVVAERPQGRRPGTGLGAGMLTLVFEDDEHLQGFPGFAP